MEMSLEDKYIIARWCYSIGEEIISDAEYNNLHRMFTEEGTLPEYTSRSWSSDPCPYELLKKYGMEDKALHIVLSDKTESMDSITEESVLKAQYKDMREMYLLSFKDDGYNFQLTYYKGAFVTGQTRGRKNDALDFSGMKELFPSEIPVEEKVKIVGEFTLSNSNFSKLRDMYPEKNLVSQRSAVRTAMANKEAWHLLTFHAFDLFIEGKEYPATYIYYLLSSWGFETPMYKAVQNYEQLETSIKAMNAARETYETPTDGLVLRKNEGRHLVAIRVLGWEEPIYKSYVIGYKEDVAAHTRPMKLEIYPIRLQNSTQSTVPITNLDRIVQNKLEIGSPVAFKFTSASIADIDEETTRILQRTYAGKYEQLQERIQMEEYAKQENGLR